MALPYPILLPPDHCEQESKSEGEATVKKAREKEVMKENKRGEKETERKREKGEFIQVEFRVGATFYQRNGSQSCFGGLSP
eukprot:1379645-Amorphochlora_amoeboformis.AAC.1